MWKQGKSNDSTFIIKVLAEHFHWTPQEILDTDAFLIDEIVYLLSLDQEKAKHDAKQREAEMKRGKRGRR